MWKSYISPPNKNYPNFTKPIQSYVAGCQDHSSPIFKFRTFFKAPYVFSVIYILQILSFMIGT